MAIPRTDPPLAASEVDTLRGYLDFHRDTLRMKCDGLDTAQLGTPLPPSSLTLGGLMKHLALVESNWFEHVMLDERLMPPFDEVDWDADPDWEFRTGATDGPEALFALFDESVARCDAAIDRALAVGGLDQLSVRKDRRGEGEPFSLRWVMVHMIEEYARHNGHADLLREAIDGSVGE
jgi:hypothetical protein